MGRFVFRFVVLLVICSLLISFSRLNIVKANGNTIYIRADGSVEPSTAPISTVDNVTYTLTDNIVGDGSSYSSAIVVERDNIVVDGAGYIVQSSIGIYSNSKGIDLSGRSNVTIKNMIIKGAFYFGIYLYSSNYNSISGNNITNNLYGIKLYYSSNNAFRNNTISNNHHNFVVDGLALSEFINDIDVSNTVDGKPVYYLINQKNLVINSSTYPNIGYLALVNSTNITVEGLKLKNNWQGILLAYTTNSQITNNNITNNEYGIYLYSSSNNTIVGNNITNNHDYDSASYSIYLNSSSYNSIVENNITNNEYGIALETSSNNIIVGNIITNNTSSIGLSYSSNTTIAENKITNNFFGIGLYYSSNSSIVGNNITNNTYDGIGLSYSSNTTIAENKITNSSYFSSINLYYSCNNNIVRNTIMESNLSGIWLFYTSNNNSISGNNITNSNMGIHLDSSNNTIVGNNITNNSDGIYLYSSSNNAVAGNDITNNNENGIDLGEYSNYNSICDNSITANNHNGIMLGLSSNNRIVGNGITENNDYGIYLLSSSNNSIIGNNITNNNFGIEISFSSHNKFYHNNFISNAHQVYDDAWDYPEYFVPSVNVWDYGYPSGGNYWSNYTGVDLYNGPYQNMTGSDGMGDTPYTIDTKNKDSYPLLGMFSSFNTSLGYDVNVISNSTIEDFAYFQSNSTIIIHVSNTTANQKYGFCRLTIPHNLLPPPYTITINSNPVAYTTLSKNEESTIIYFSYKHSTLEIIITPESPSTAILLLFITTAFIITILIAVIIYRRKHFL